MVQIRLFDPPKDNTCSALNAFYTITHLFLTTTLCLLSPTNIPPLQMTNLRSREISELFQDDGNE